MKPTPTFKLIASCIQGALNQLHLDTCRQMIDTRIKDADEKNELYNKMQVREVEIIVHRYPVYE